jgi:dipeptidyl aminopeptidase/acylaminoacyl peptidase
MSRTRTTILAFVLISNAFGVAEAQVKTTLKPDDYKQWQALVAPQISNDGHWLAYQIALVDGDGQLVIKNSDKPEKAEVADGGSAKFSDDSRWCGYLVTPPKATVDKLKEEKKPIETKFALRSLDSGREISYDGIQAFTFTKGSKALLLSRYRGTTKAEGGSDLVVINLATGEPITIGNVVAALPNYNGDLIALSIVSDSGQKGVQLLNLATNSLRTLKWGKEDVYDLDWAGKADVVGFLIGTVDEKKEGDSNIAVVVSNLKAPNLTLKVFDPAKEKGFPKGDRIAEYGQFILNEDGTIAAFGAAAWKDKKKPDPKPLDKPGVEVWNTKDVRVIPEQRVEAGRDKLKTVLCTWHPANDALAVISDGDVQTGLLMPKFEHAVLIDPKPYLNPVTNGIHYHDVYVVDTMTGLRTKVLEHTQWTPVPSLGGKYFAYFERKNWWIYDIKEDKKRNVTEDIHAPFDDVDDDHTVPEKPPVGFPKWLANDDGVVLEDKYDCYLERLGTNSITPLTNGRKDKLIYRFVAPEPSEDGPSVQKPFFYTVFDEIEKSSGFYKSDAAGKGKLLVLDNKSFSSLIKAKDVDRMLFVMGSFEDSPNLFLTNTEMTASKPESKTNPQQANYKWGHTELVKFKSRWGKDLQGTLIYPADYVKGHTYPMVTYIYEKLSNNLHSYVGPVDWSSYNPQVLSQNGYFVYMPDITYKPRNPGLSAVDCLEPAIDAVLALHVGVDSTKIGLMGHSWGAYQTAFVTTVSKTFAVGVAGAPLTELTSMYNSFYWNAGITDQEIFETSQGRMEVPFWEDPKVYFDNSPVWQSKKRTAPILFTFGDSDGAVDYHQGQYLYNTLRRMGKNAVMLLYAGENHGLAKRANQLDYAHKVRHYLDVYLKGVKPEPWVTEDVPLLKQLDQ